MSVVGKELGDSIANNASAAFADFVMGTKSAGEAFKSFAAGVLQDIARIATRLAVLNMLAGFGMSFAAPAGGAAPAAAGASGGAIWGTAPLKRFAGGGLPGVDRLHLVGEHGPELFATGTRGRILSYTDTMRAVSGGGENTNNITINVSGNGSTQREGSGASAEQQAALGERIRAAVVEILYDEQRRNGVLHKNTAPGMA
jgi:phage-related minor tail protein